MNNVFSRMTEPHESYVHDDTEDNRNIQPHFGSLQFKDPASPEQVNPAFESDDVTTKDFPKRAQNSNGSSTRQSSTPQTSGVLSNNSTFPVMFSSSGQSGVVQEQVVIQRPDGSKVISTEQCNDYTRRYKKKRKPLRKERITRLKILSVLSLFVYFPLGIPAVYFAFNIQKEFDAGIIQGNIDKAQKYASRAEKLVIFSVCFAILTAVLVFALVDRLNGNHDDYTSPNRILPAG